MGFILTKKTLYNQRNYKEWNAEIKTNQWILNKLTNNNESDFIMFWLLALWQEPSDAAFHNQHWCKIIQYCVYECFTFICFKSSMFTWFTMAELSGNRRNKQLQWCKLYRHTCWIIHNLHELIFNIQIVSLALCYIVIMCETEKVCVCVSHRVCSHWRCSVWRSSRSCSAASR